MQRLAFVSIFYMLQYSLKYLNLLLGFICQVEDFDHELFVEQSSCYDSSNFTEEQCRGKRCCYIEEYNVSNFSLF